jgi:hypothetical protein
VDTRSCFPGDKMPGVKLTIRRHPDLSLRRRGAVTPLYFIPSLHAPVQILPQLLLILLATERVSLTLFNCE